MAATPRNVCSSGAITDLAATGDTGWIEFGKMFTDKDHPIEKGFFFIISDDIADAEEITVTLKIAFSEAHRDAGGITAHVFNALKVGTLSDYLVAPAGYSVSALNSLPIPPWIKLEWAREALPAEGSSCSFIAEACVLA